MSAATATTTTTTTTPPATVTVDLPPRFYDHHAGEDKPAGTVVKRLAKSVRVELDNVAYSSLLAGARASLGEGTDRALRKSAIATVGVLERTPRPAAPPKPRRAPKAEPAAPAPVPAQREARTWVVTSVDDTHKCAGACSEVKTATSFPTTGKVGVRGVECRKCRDARKAAAK